MAFGDNWIVILCHANSSKVVVNNVLLVFAANILIFLLIADQD